MGGYILDREGSFGHRVGVKKDERTQKDSSSASEQGRNAVRLTAVLLLGHICARIIVKYSTTVVSTFVAAASHWVSILQDC